MPRLAPSVFRRAGRISPHLATLLPSCRTIEAAQREQRWIRRHVLDTSPSELRGDVFPSRNGKGGGGDRVHPHSARIRARWKSSANSRSDTRSRLDAAEDTIARLVARRGAGEPLQYVLGTQPFGDLEILCTKGVLIPRPETEAWASMLADLMLSPPLSPDRTGVKDEEELHILDLCSGTGCIGLSLYVRGMATKGTAVRVSGFDVEPRAVRLARRNLLHNFREPGLTLQDRGHGGAVAFRQADIFAEEWMADLDDAGSHQGEGQGQRPRRIDVLVSNPPYISQRGFDVDTGRSVRNYEPRIALVPARASSLPSHAVDWTCAPEDIFHARLLDIAVVLRPRIAAFEVGDMRQAVRVVEMAMARSRPRHIDGSRERTEDEQAVARWDILEIWRDWPDCQPLDAENDAVLVCGREVPVRGSGHGRVVFLAEGQMMWNRFTNRGFKRQLYAGP
ncbi:S-adenosyl-L-methionine-dependent methyltransferase [Xylaria digitata]|nr:S-adenosyl-L-methionine-dependent methyltransferase [Xylaria digitata]